MGSLHFIAAQVAPRSADFDHNLRQVIEAIERVPAAPGQVIVFPEFALCGPLLDGLANDADVQRAAEQQFSQLLKHLRNLPAHPEVLITGLGVTKTGQPTSRLWWISGGQIRGTHDKLRLTDRQSRHLRPGSQHFATFEIADHRVGVIFADDLDSGAAAKLPQHLAGLAVISCTVFEQDELPGLPARVQKLARTHRAVTAWVNPVGAADEYIFPGVSVLADARGQIQSLGAYLAPDLLGAEALGAEQVGHHQSGLPQAGLHRPSEMHDRLQALQATDIESRSARLYHALVFALQHYIRDNGFSRVCLGMSGGIDSALVAAIAADALGGDNVLGISMPSKVSTDHSVTDAADQAKRQGIELRSIPIEPLVEAFTTTLPLTGTALENIQARIRGMLLMSVSNQEGPVVLAPGNKSELAMGYSTVYGDAVGGFAPIKDVYKSQVWQLARWRNNAALDAGELPVIPEHAITKPPSAELRSGQLDQDSLPEYHLLDAVLFELVECGRSFGEVVAAGFDAKIALQAVQAMDRSEWKRRQYPAGPKVSARAFSPDRIIPITHAWNPKEEL